MTSSAGTSRVLQKLHASLDRQEYYEAHQMYRTLYFRYSSQKKFPELLDLLFDGALNFLERGQMSSGSDLALLFADSLVEAKPDLSENLLIRLEQLLAKLPPGDKVPMGPEGMGPQVKAGVEDSASAVNTEVRVKFMDASLKWSKGLNGVKEYQYTGHPSLHQRFAGVYWSEKNYPQARYHFMLSEDGEGCAMFLIELHTQRGYPGEIDLFLAQAVLQYLCNQKKKTANVLFLQYTLKHPSIQESGPPFGLPLLNFLWLLLISIDIGRVQYFTILIEQYQPTIQRDPCYLQYLDRIGQVFFGLPPPKPKQKTGGGLFMDLFKGLLGKEDESMGEEMIIESNGEGEEEEFRSLPNSPVPGDTHPHTSTTDGRMNGEVSRGGGSLRKPLAEPDLD